MDEIIARREPARRNIADRIFYDSANPVEIYYTGLLAGLPLVAAQPLALGLSHYDGCIRMFEMGLVQRAVIAEAS
jgi:hypothetical protein